MQNKSVAYMLVAVLIGVTLITAIPDQMARITSPREMLSMESGDGESTVLSKAGNETVALYWDSTSAPEENVTDDHEIWFEVVNSTGHDGPLNRSVEVEGLEFSVNASEAAAEAAGEARSTQKTLNMFMWYAFDALIAVGVYFLAKNRFG